MKDIEIRENLISTALTLREAELNRGMSGNLSVRTPTGFLISPSAVPDDLLEIDDLVPVTFEGEWPKQQKPSSEWLFHRDIYQHREDAKAVIHTHPPWCTTLACLRKDIPAVHYLVALAGGDSIRCADYAMFGTQQLSDFVLMALEGRKACLMANHGMLCLDEDLDSALALVIEVENLARVYCQALQLGEPALLSGQEMDEVIEALQSYRGSD